MPAFFIRDNMNKQDTQMKWILFWVFLILFIVMVLGTLGIVFFDFGAPTENERELMVYGLILEVAACVVALFHSIFRLKKEDNLEINIEELKDEIKNDIQAYVNKLSAMHTPSTSSGSDTESNQTALTYDLSFDSDYQKAADAFNAPPPFDTNKYKLKPQASDIDSDINSAKPYEKSFREQSYIGMLVQWKVCFSTITEYSNTYNIRASTSVSMFKVNFEIDKTAGARFRTAEKGLMFWLSGKISGFTLDMKLEDVQIDFCD